MLVVYLSVEVQTDEGISGVGESGAWGFLEASATAVDTFRRYLIGQDQLRIDHRWQYLYRYSFFRDAAITGALSGIDIALRDIAGKLLGLPVYQLLGGRTHDRARLYHHVFGESTGERVRVSAAARAAGSYRIRAAHALPGRTP